MAQNILEWWKSATAYHIYIPSFSDFNADGIGDIPGVIPRLPYLQSLGIDLIYVSPFYASPQHDMGYDVSDYTSVYPPYGTVQDVKRLIDACHVHSMKIIFDLVVNHTSSLHSWFLESRRSRTSEKRNWYHWRPPKYDGNGNRKPPNNWMSVFGGSAWEWDEVTEEYYLHIYLKEQPDLNWDNKDLRQAVYDDAIKFWVEKGVDGFRIDTVCIYAKDPNFPDAEITNPDSEFQLGRKYYADLDVNFQYLTEMREVVKSYEGRDIVMFGEYSGGTTSETALRYCGRNGPLDSGFHKQLLDLERTVLSKWMLKEPAFELKRFMEVHKKWQALVDKEVGGWTTAYLENHDVARSVSRFLLDNDPNMRVAFAKMLAVLMATSSGTLFLYQGEEIGMTSMPREWGIEEYRDSETLKYYQSVLEGRSNGETVEQALESIKKIARDHGRTPMQWDGSSNAGFTTAEKPWMRVNNNYHHINVEEQETNSESVLEFWKKMIRIRKKYPKLFISGRLEASSLISDEAANRIGLYWKKCQEETANEKAFVVMNFSSREIQMEELIKSGSPEIGYPMKLKMLVSSYGDNDSAVLQPYEARVFIEFQ